MKEIVLMIPPMMLIGQVEQWPNPKPSEADPTCFLLRKAAAIQRINVPTPEGMRSGINLQGLGDRHIRMDGWAGWGEPERDEADVYMQFRAAAAGIDLTTQMPPGPEPGRRN